MDFSTLLGFLGVMTVLGFGIHDTGVAQIFLNPHGLVIVLLGSFTAMLINTPLGMLFGAIRAYLRLFLSSRAPAIDSTITEIVKLAEKARSEGGMLTLQDEGKDVAGGFLNRALN